jgi:serine/threonine protein kinase
MQWKTKIIEILNKEKNSQSSLSPYATVDNYRSFPSKKYGSAVKFLGQGVSSKVYLYKCLQNNTYYAVKSFVKKDLKDSDNLDVIRKEISIHRILNGNQHIVNMIDAFTIKNNTQFFIILEYLPTTLAKFYSTYGKMLPLIERLCYFKQIVYGLQFLQSQNIGHRDIKLENCCIDINGNIKIIDFGSSTIGSIGYGMAGSPDYSAPEIHNNLKYDSFKCDIWSLGIILVNLFYLTKQKWKVSRYDDVAFDKYKKFPVINNVMTSSKATINPDFTNEERQSANALILQLLKVDVDQRIKLDYLINSNPWFLSLSCCTSPIPNNTTNHNHIFLKRIINRNELT